MAYSPTLPAAYGSTLLGIWRIAAFLMMSLVLPPFQIIYAAIVPKNRYIMPLYFHRTWMALLGFKVRTYGIQSKAPATLFVANHASYLDIPVLGSLIQGSFVAKAEVASWPLLGFLSKLQDTAFIERRSSKAGEHKDQLRAYLDEGRSLILFPEGTSSDGLQVFPFKSSLFSIVENAPADKPVTVQPVSVTCTGVGNLPLSSAWRSHYAWYGDMTLGGHFWDVFRIGCFRADVIFHPPVTVKNFSNRKALAAYCQEQVARGIEASLRGRDDPLLQNMQAVSLFSPR